jgi:hypothetical protein
MEVKYFVSSPVCLYDWQKKLKMELKYFVSSPIGLWLTEKRVKHKGRRTRRVYNSKRQIKKKKVVSRPIIILYYKFIYKNSSYIFLEGFRENKKKTG